MSVKAYPLEWPPGFARSARRERGQFKTTLAGALKNVDDSLRRFGTDSHRKVDQVVMSSNVTLGASRPADPGVAVWFTWDTLGLCIAVDRYDTVEANLQAIHHIIEARRVELRHGTLALVRATFRGFLALPAPPEQRHWSEVLGVPRDVTRSAVKGAYRLLASKRHPDKEGGSDAAFQELNAALEQALLECAE